MQTPELDRKTAPAAAPLSNILFPEIERRELSNGIPVYVIPFGIEEILDLRVVFPAGKSFEEKKGVAGIVATMLQEGTKSYTGFELAQELDRLGSFVSASSGYESITLTLTTLARHIPYVLPVFREVCLEPVFPKTDLEKMLERKIQSLEVEQKKTGFRARQEFNKLLFGNSHPYGQSLDAEDLGAITREDLVGHHEKTFRLDKAVIVASGRFGVDGLIALLENEFGHVMLPGGHQGFMKDLSPAEAEPEIAARGLQYFEMPDTMQATVRVGHLGFKRDHPDYYAMQVVNTILGGYFGSRLMRNIREEKGYTYGIGSGWAAMKYHGLFIVQTDVGNEYIKPTLEEIRKEIQLLIDKGVSEEELSLVKNYMVGKSVSRRETPSQIGDTVVSALVTELDFAELDRKFDAIMRITSQQVQELAAKHLRPEKMLEVVCGKMSEKM